MSQDTISETSKPKKYVRKRRTDLALEVALRDAAAATESGADPSVLNLLRARLTVLNQRLHKEEKSRLRKAVAEADRLRAENEKLKAELAQALTAVEQQRRTPVIVNETLEQKTARLLRQFDTSDRVSDAGTF